METKRSKKIMEKNYLVESRQGQMRQNERNYKSASAAAIYHISS